MTAPRRPKLDPDLATVAADVTIPAAATRALAEGERPCGPGRLAFRWDRRAAVRSELVGQPISVYCQAAAACMSLGECVGPRFVPHVPQPRPGDGGPSRVQNVTLREAVLASKVAAADAASRTGVPDRRTDQEVADSIRESVAVANRELASGGWRPS